MQARYYDPVIGRFLSHDPVQFSVEQPLMFNRYGYTFNNPLNLVDPDGMWPRINCQVCKNFSKGFTDALKANPIFLAHEAGLVAGNHRAHTVNSAINASIDIIRSDWWEAMEFSVSYVSQNKARMTGRLFSQTLVNIAAYRGMSKIGGYKARNFRLAGSIGTLNFTTSQFGSAIEAFNGLYDDLNESGYDMSKISNDAIANAFIGAASGAALNFDSESGTLYLINGSGDTDDRVKVCQFDDNGSCKS